eukprot:CAMPEP_0114660118 /NCGR_PEP_ID=MMETSP0191-20121206/19325_1 /TAXON_ID=126664 /ORGANISM="Sorites sp." /LENGTH=241 /DNA_ID=CAMNT_0001887615 /DNA_START=31 /DNA_END=756 /DNA_ORIENTATION=+
MPTLKNIYVERRTNTELRNALEILDRFGKVIRRSIKLKCEWCKGTTKTEELLAEMDADNVGIVSINDTNFPHYNYLRGHPINFVRDGTSGRTWLTCERSTRNILDDHTEPSDWDTTAVNDSYYSASGGDGSDSAGETEEDIDIKGDSTALKGDSTALKGDSTALKNGNIKGHSTGFVNGNINGASQNNNEPDNVPVFKKSKNDPVTLKNIGAPNMDDINIAPDPTQANIFAKMDVDSFLNE